MDSTLEKLGWPAKGEVVFKNLSMRYNANSKPVLKNINFSIKPGEKVALLGKSGSGKSSIISALFRLREIDPTVILYLFYTIND